MTSHPPRGYHHVENSNPVLTVLLSLRLPFQMVCLGRLEFLPALFLEPLPHLEPRHETRGQHEFELRQLDSKSQVLRVPRRKTVEDYRIVSGVHHHGWSHESHPSYQKIHDQNHRDHQNWPDRCSK